MSADKVQQAKAEEADAAKSLTEQQQRLLWDEFKLVQDKIDRIGDFHFRVRTWAITLTIAIIASGAASKVPWWVLIAALPLIFSFQAIDRAQSRWQDALSRRADSIEDRLRAAIEVGPRVVQSLRQADRILRDELLGWFVRKNGLVFYIVMYLLTLAAISALAYGHYCGVKPPPKP